MASDITSRILQQINRPDLITVLANVLSGTALNSVLLDVFELKTASLSPPQLLNLYQQNRFVKPADLPVIKVKRMELDILELFARHSFEAIELSPVTILGACSVLGPAAQKKILSALRGTEVLADSTNAIALHACDLKQKQPITETSSPVWMRCCNIQRQLRTQAIQGKGFRPHFRIGCLVTCGQDTGAYAFEKQSLYEHMQVMKTLFLDYYKVDEISFRLLRREGYPDTGGLLREAREYFRKNDPAMECTIVDNPESNTRYYKGIQYKVDIRVRDKVYEIGDGGFVDWTQHLLQNRKERMLSTGFGFDLMVRILSGEI